MFIDKIIGFQEAYIESSKMFFSEQLILVGLLLLYLIISSITDIKSMMIYTEVSMAFVVIRLFLAIWYPISWSNVGGAAFLIAFVFIIAFITYTNMGGDIKAMLPIGLFLGFSNSVVFIAGSICILLLVGIVVYFATKDRKKEIPFAPILLASYSIMALINFI
ncbi:prepilin peptidase [Lysinibacillus sp. UGB7]|uniref:prepilin peptidase n=1 Tax=Lysinibacillus sp. UGB7 TaxID=3411039 RepID=UPI003B804873